MSKRILVVEDQPDNRQIIRDMVFAVLVLRIMGFAMYGARNDRLRRN